MTAFLWYCPARGGGRGAGRLVFPGQTPRRGVRSVAHSWIWDWLAAGLQADQPSLVRKAWGLAVWVSRMIPDPSS